MKNYELKTDEVVLYKGDIMQRNTYTTSQLILTNYNIIFDSDINQDVVVTESYPIEEVKMYNGEPQIKTKGNIVEIYFMSTEKEFQFMSKLELIKFINTAKKLLTGKNKFERGAEKYKKAMQTFNKAIDDETVASTKNAIGKVTDVTTTIATAVKPATNKAAKLLEKITHKNNSKDTKLLENKDNK